MSEDIFVKTWLLPMWIVVIVLVFVFGLPLAHTVSSMDTVLFNVKQDAIQGAPTNALVGLASQEISATLPTELDGTSLFNSNNDMVVTVNDTAHSGKITLVYHVPIFAPFINLFGVSGPTMPIPFTTRFTPSSSDESGVTYLQ